MITNASQMKMKAKVKQTGKQKNTSNIHKNVFKEFAEGTKKAS